MIFSPTPIELKFSNILRTKSISFSVTTDETFLSDIGYENKDDSDFLRDPNLLTYFVEQKTWTVYTEGTWHTVSMSFVKHELNKHARTGNYDLKGDISQCQLQYHQEYQQ